MAALFPWFGSLGGIWILRRMLFGWRGECDRGTRRSPALSFCGKSLCQVPLMMETSQNFPVGLGPEPLARRMGETMHRSPLRRRAAVLGLRDGSDLLTLAVRRGCRHLANVVPDRGGATPALAALADEELVVVLLAGENPFEPFLIRAAAELVRAAKLDAVRLAGLARRERCARVLAYIARAGAARDSAGADFWTKLLAALGPQRSVAPGVLPHWSRFVALEGVSRDGRNRGARWIGAAA